MGLIPKLITDSSGSLSIRSNSFRGVKRSPIAAIASNLQPRQSNPTFTAIPSTYGQTNGPSPGAVAGIVLGAVAAFLLLLYLIYAILHGGPVILFRTNPPPRSGGGESSTGSRSVVSFRTRETGTGRASRRGSKRKSKRSSRAETVEIRRSRGTPVTIVEPPAPPPPPPAPPRTVSSLSYDDEIDVVVVEEEHTPPRRTSQRGFRRDSRTYRDVDPEMFVGGDDPEFNVRRGSRYGRERY